MASTTGTRKLTRSSAGSSTSTTRRERANGAGTSSRSRGKKGRSGEDGRKGGRAGGAGGRGGRRGTGSGSSEGRSRSVTTRGGGRQKGGDECGGGLASPFREHLGAQRRDIGGLALVVLGVVVGLGTYADAAGPVGAFLEAVTLGLLGLVGYLIPVLLTWFGLLVVVGRPSPEIGRIAVGSVVLVSGVLGGLHLLAGAPQPADGIRGLWRAGGLVGWGVATPLEWALSVWGAAAVLTALVLLGLLVITSTPISELVTRIGAAIRSDDELEEAGAATPDGSSTEDTAREERDARVRATLAGKTGSETGSEPAPAEPEPAPRPSQATLESARQDETRETLATPAPPVERARVPAESSRKKAAKVRPVEDWDDYVLPSMDLLASGRTMERQSRRTIDAQTAALQETFDQFGVDAKVARWSRGPTVTRFEIELGPGVQVKKVANMGDDIAYALAAPDVRIVAPIPGKSAIGVEVPNRERDLITLGDILRSDEARADRHPLTVAMGVDIAGNPEVVNLATMPHLLVSGATGSGKSVTLNGMIHSIVMRARPDQVRMILIDPKRVELNAYAGAPHLLSPVVTDPRRAADAVQWCVKEMEQRYELLAHLGFRNIDSYNDAVAAGEVQPRLGPEGEPIEARPLPYILLVIDELADLMLVAPRDVEDAICRIAQMARAVGIHMIIATQRPSVDVITGLIKANIPSRLALQVASQTDSRTIIDMNGAEKLVGKGDMLFLPASQGKPSRLQGCWVTEREISTAVSFCRAQREPEFEETVVKEGADAEQVDAVRSGDDTSDQALLRRAAEQVVVSGLGSTSMLQRKLRIGFARAGRLMDELEELGVVGPNEGSKAREVLWSPEQLDEASSTGAI